jgi:hypothetical protein
MFSRPEIAILIFKDPRFMSLEEMEELDPYAWGRRAGDLTMWPAAILTPLSLLICLVNHFYKRHWKCCKDATKCWGYAVGDGVGVEGTKKGVDVEVARDL